jgi:hypothetical protein
VRALLQTAPNPNIGAALVATSPAYVENGSNTYALCRSF